MLENLAAKGIKRVSGPSTADIETCKRYHPEAVGCLIAVASEFGYETGAIFLDNIVPDWLVSAYRDRPADASVNNSPHYFGVAFDVMAGNVLKQIEFVELAVEKMRLFNRGGIYIGRNTCHVDRCDDGWMTKYKGSKFWVWHSDKYFGFTDFGEASKYALRIITPGD
jgi:hypothetical protein